MGFLHNLMNKLGRYRLIPDRRTGEDYMHRYYLFLKDRKKFPFNVTLHKILKSDDPIFHDHPWPYMTIILKGGYWEHTPVFNSEGKIFAEFTLAKYTRRDSNPQPSVPKAGISFIGSHGIFISNALRPWKLHSLGIHASAHSTFHFLLEIR